MQKNGGDYAWYAGDKYDLESGVEKTIEVEFTMNNETDTDARVSISMGKVGEVEAPASTIEISNVSLVKVEDAPASNAKSSDDDD